ncbi:MAG: AAA-like domain-containing protein, partial [Anaerolineae bacterium]
MSWPIIFTVGGTVQAGGGLYISRKADRELLNLCRAGAFAYVLTSRQMGKSSLMVRTAESLAKEDARSVIIDLTQLGVQVTAQEWHLGLLTAVEDSLELDTDVVDWWQQNTHLSVTKRLTLFFEEVLLAEVAGRVVIFIDEIDSTLSLPFTDDFYAAIRYFYNARAFKPEFHRLSFVLIGVATPGDLIADPKRTPFNIGQRVDLTDFTIEEALPLTEGLNLPPDEARRVLSWVLKWTGGHPYLTQRTCRIVAQQGRADWTEADIDRLVAGTFLGEQSEQDNNLQFVRDMLTKRAPDFKSTLATYRDIRLKRRPVEDEEQSLVKSHLKLSGVVRRKGNNLVVRNRIYAEVFNRQWINQHWPVDRRQRLQVVLGTVAGSLVTLLLAVLAVSWVADRFSTAQATAQAEAQAAQATATHIQATAEAQAILDATAQANIAATATLESARADDATSRQLAAQAINALDETRPDLALLLSVEALRAADTWEARSSLLAAFQTFPHLYAVLQPTPQDLWRMAFSPNGQLLAAAAEDGTIYLWDVDTRRPFSDPLNGNTEKVWSLAFDPAGQRLAAGSTDGVLIVWDVDTRRPVYRFDNTPGESIAGVAFSPNGQTLVAGSWDASIRFWDLSGGHYS